MTPARWLPLLALAPALGLAPPAACRADDLPSRPGRDDTRMVLENVVVIQTSLGTIGIELYPGKAPVTVENFLRYVREGFYDGTVFHRVIGKENTPGGRDFMIQGGGHTTEHAEKKTRPPIKNEAGNGLSNVRGTIAMARASDPDSATAQFFINVADNEFLDKNNRGAGYAVFGKVIRGMDVVDRIKAVKTGEKTFTTRDPRDATKTVETPFQNVPVEDVVIKSVRVGRAR